MSLLNVNWVKGSKALYDKLISMGYTPKQLREMTGLTKSPLISIRNGKTPFKLGALLRLLHHIDNEVTSAWEYEEICSCFIGAATGGRIVKWDLLEDYTSSPNLFKSKLAAIRLEFERKGKPFSFEVASEFMFSSMIEVERKKNPMKLILSNSSLPKTTYYHIKRGDYHLTLDNFYKLVYGVVDAKILAPTMFWNLITTLVWLRGVQ